MQDDQSLPQKQDGEDAEKQFTTMESQCELWTMMDCRNCLLMYQRMFGKYVTAIKFKNMIKEIMLKASLYNLFQSLTIRQVKENKDSLFKRVMQQSR